MQAIGSKPTRFLNILSVIKSLLPRHERPFKLKNGTLVINSDVVQKIEFSGTTMIESRGSLGILSDKYLVLESGWYQGELNKYKIHLNPSITVDGTTYRVPITHLGIVNKEPEQLELFHIHHHESDNECTECCK